MLKRNITVVILACCSLMLTAQTVRNGQNKILDDSVIDVPEDMKRNYDELLSTWRNDLQFSTNCTAIGDDLMHIPDSVYINRLYSLPTRMELVYNPVVRNFIEMYAGRRRDQVSYMLGKGKFYFPLFEDALDKEGIPLELKYLPVIESALNPIARSRVGATGLWQFMVGTGKMYSLEINSLVDERRDPHKSTAAAAKYLKDLYAIYGDWNLVIAAYNCGPGNVNKAMRRSGDKKDYWEIYPYLPKETRNYVPAFIAATYIMNYFEEHSICPATYQGEAVDTLSINKTMHLEQVSNILNVSMDELRMYNPEFTSDIIPGEYKSYELKLPFSKISDFVSKESDILAYRSDELLTHRKVAGLDVISRSAKGGSNSIAHRVRKGETISKIAQKYGVTASQIKSWNGLKSNKLAQGRRLTIYQQMAEKASETLASQSVADGESGDRMVEYVTIDHEIERGDTWASIARRYDVSVETIKDWNKKSKKLLAGRTLSIRQPKPIEEKIFVLPEPELVIVSMDSSYIENIVESYVNNIEREESSLPLVSIGTRRVIPASPVHRVASNDSRTIYHKVRAGETVVQIAARYMVEKKDIMAWNKLSSDAPKVGQRLLILLPVKNNKSNIAHTDNKGDYSSKTNIH